MISSTMSGGNQTLLKTMKKVPSKVIEDQISGKSIFEQYPKPKIIQFLNIGDNSIYTDSQVNVDEPIFQPEPHVIQFTNYEELQTKEQILKLRNKDKVARWVKIIPPDSKLFQVYPCKKNKLKIKGNQKISKPADTDNMSWRVAPGMEICYTVKFSPETKMDYSYDLMIVTEREKFIVPIRAVGYRSMLDFPDSLDFGLVPVKHVAEKPVMVRNIGEKTTKWHIKVPDGFNVDKTEGILEVGDSEQLVFQFIPQESRPYKEELLLWYDNLEAAIQIFGESHNDNVYLSKNHLHMEDTYITLYSHQYFQIVNKSSVPVEFSWRAFQTEVEENKKKSQLIAQLNEEESEERMILEESNLEESIAESLDSDDSYDEDELNKKQERAQTKAITTLARKYQSIRKAVEEDLMLFQDEIFTIEPLQGKLWPGTEVTCCVTFKPQGPLHYSCTAFCNITCSEERLPLNLTGQGIGPKAALSIKEWDIGDIFVNSEQEYRIAIENKGDITCYYKLIPYETPFGSKFHFSKTEGMLGVKDNQSDIITVTFKSDILGEFSETFRWALEGSVEMLSLTFKGHVVAPTFKFSEEIIDFGQVSYKFPAHKTVYLTNTSDVDINYVIRVPGDERSLQNEFNITNDRGKLVPKQRQKIIIEFIPGSQRQYDMCLMVDLEGVGQDMLAVPIKAECLVPKVKITPGDYLDFKDVFLRHPKTMEIELKNEDYLEAKFEILPQEENYKRVGIFKADQESGIIPPRSTIKLQITLRTEMITQNVRIPMSIKVEGYHIPFMLTILANSTGPKVIYDQDELDFGNVEVLHDVIKPLKITNVSKIPAEYTAFTKNKVSVWKVIQRHGILQPDESKTLEVVCNADECQKFTDTLHVIVNNGMDLEIGLKAKGIGTTLACKANLKEVNFGTKYTHSNETMEFFLENRGRKPQKIQWSRVNKPVDRNKAKAKKEGEGKEETKNEGSAKDASMISEKKEENEELKYVFAVVPDQVVLQPKMGIFIQFRANSFQKGRMTEQFVCTTVVGGERKPKEAYKTTCVGEFIGPQLEYSDPKLSFKYKWEKNVPAMPIQKPLDITNVGNLPTTITLKIVPPFSCNSEVLTLPPGHKETINIDFDPGMRQDRMSGVNESKLQITHKGHPQKDFVELFGEVCYPNLNIDPPKISFGCILNDTSKKKYITMKNISEMVWTYDWSFLEEETTNLNRGEDEPEEERKAGTPINEIFDILPVSGILKEGETETVEFTFYSGHGRMYNGIAVWSVDGGPDYQVPLEGESSYVSYKLSTNEIDFGEITYCHHDSKDFYIENIGKVPFAFNINLSTITRPGMLEVNPMTGKVMSGERFRVNLKFKPGIPDNIDEIFLVECAHFPAERFKIKAVGTFPWALLTFQRNDETFQERYEKTKRLLEKNKIKYDARFVSTEIKVTPVPGKGKQDKVQSDIFDMDIQAETDRLYLWEKLLEQQELIQARTAVKFNDTKLNATMNATKPNAKGSPNKTQGFDQNQSGINLEDDDKIIVTNYICDFGNMVVGSSKRKTFRMTNCGKNSLSFSFDTRLLQNIGIAIDPPKPPKQFVPNSSLEFKVTYSTRKNAKHGKVRHIVPIHLSYGPSYTIEFVANLTIPELAMSTDNVEFNKVCVGTRKIIRVRFENKKEVACDWSYYYKPDVAGVSAKEGEKFSVSPTSGYLLPGQKQTVDVIFTPTHEKVVTQKLQFKCKENSKLFALNVRGYGINYALDIIEHAIEAGPVLPYDKSAVKIVQIRNPMAFPIEVYSTDFDKQYIEEEEILKKYDPLNNEKGDVVFEELRKAGKEFWPNIKEAVEKRKQLEAVQNKIKEIEEKLEKEFKIPEPEEGKEPEPLSEEQQQQKEVLEKEKATLEQQIQDAEAEKNVIKKVIPKVKKSDRLSIILFGPEKCGKSTIAYFLSEEQQRGIVNLSELLSWWEKNNTPTYAEAAKYLEERDEECKVQEELEKKKKKKKPEEEEFDPKIYKYLPKEMLMKMIVERTEHEDCNAGMIFDNLLSENWKDEKEIINAISDALSEENVQLVIINLSKDEDGLDYCDNYKYLMRKNYIPDADEKETLDKTFIEKKDKSEKKSQKRGRKKELTEDEKKEQEEKKRKQEEEEKQKLLKEEEDRRRLDEPEPKVLTDEEREEFERKWQEMVELFTEINLRQMNQKHQVDMEGEGEGEKEENEEGKKEENQDIKDIEEKDKPEGEGEGEKEVKQKKEHKHFGTRSLYEVPIQYNFRYLCEKVRENVPDTIWPDPDKEPLPPPTIQQIIKKPSNRPEKPKVTLFSIWTPVEKKENEGEGEEEKEAEKVDPKAKGKKDPKTVKGKEEPKEPEENKEEQKGPHLDKSITRWILQPNESKPLYIKFFSTKIGKFHQILNFEIVGSSRQFPLDINALCEFPTINTNPKNVFMTQKRQRPATPPESYLQKCFVVNENVFDFGPLLIGKDAEKRKDDEVMKKANSSEFRITNNGKYDLEVKFALESTLAGDDTQQVKSPFIFEPQNMTLKVEETENLVVWWFPSENKVYNDKIVALIKDNPNPAIFNVMCIGAKPVVKIDNPDVKFDRLLLNKPAKRTLKLTNDWQIPVKWALKSTEELPPEFKISKNDGVLKPCQDVDIEITFSSEKQDQFHHKLTLEVEDTEGYNIKQEPQEVNLSAEAFDITVDIDLKNEENILDFGAVRVGEPKQKTMTLTNHGKYVVKYGFNMKKKSTREIFTIEPNEGELQPEETKDIIVRFESNKEFKMKTTHSTSDIKLTILEGASKEKFNEIPVNFNVNAVFSKYIIVPLKNINFGPMQYGEQKDLSFEIKNNGLFPFKYAICDYIDEEAKKAIKAERDKEIQERRDEVLGTGAEEAKDPKAKKQQEQKPKAGKDAKGAPAGEGEELKVSQFSIRPKAGTIEPDSSASIKVHFNAEGAQFYEKSLAIDISGRDYQDQPSGIKFDISAESCIPGINTIDLDSIFEEQTVIPSLDPSVNTQSVITSSLYAIQERVFWFGTLVASKVPEGVVEKFKIINPNKIPWTVNFSVKPRSQSKNEGFAFEISPEHVKIPPHENAYVKVSFKPENMMQYGGIFQAVVEHGDPESSSGKFTFELRGEGTLPTLLLTKPTELSDEGFPLLRLKKTRINKSTTGSITLHNEGAIPATVKFKPFNHDNLEFKGQMSKTLEPKEYYSWDVEFKPTKIDPVKYLMEFETKDNPFECHKVVIMAEGYQETITFENLPEDQEDELRFGDAIVKKSKKINFTMINTSEKPVRFEWSVPEPGFTFLPSVGYLKPKSSKVINVRFLSDEPVEHKNIEIICDSKTITQATSEFQDWDDSMTEIKLIRPSELKKILAIKEAKERRKKEEAEAAAAAAAKKGKKPPPKKEDERLPEEDMEIDETEEATEEYAEALPEPHFEVVEGSEKQNVLKGSVVADYVNYECDANKIIFKPTLMFATRSYKFHIRNTSKVALNYSFKVLNQKTGLPDSGPFSVSPRIGTIPAGTDEIVIVKFSPQEIEKDFSRILQCKIPNLSPNSEKLTIQLDGVAERPICHFELPPSAYREKKGKDMTPIDSKYKIIEFQSLGTKVKNTTRFMVANPTSHRYDFEWQEVEDEDPSKPQMKKEKPMFRWLTPKGTILSGKKFEMVFEYTPDNVGEHESFWKFKIPTEDVVQPFMVVGFVVEPIVLFETGKINFGPLLLGGKSREKINLINQEHLPFTFNFNKNSVKENPDYGDSLQVTPMSGTVPPQSQMPIEVVFKPKYETDYNYNLICNVKRKARPLVLNVKGTGYAIHYSVLADKARMPVLQNESHTFEFGDFFVNEKKVKSLVIENSGDFNFDFLWKRQPNKYITIEPESGTVKRGESLNIDIIYLPINAHQLKNYKWVLKIPSGPKFNFLLNGTARKPGIQMSFHQYDFGPCFVTRQPMSIKAVLELVNNDDAAISIETNFEKKPYLDVQLSPGEVLLPSTKEKEEKLQIPIIFTPRDIMSYNEVVTFDFNGIYNIDVVIKGEGIPMNIELVDPDQHIVDFGIVSKASDITKTVNLINKSRKPITFSLRGAIPEDLVKNSLTITPSEEVVLKPKKVLPIEVRFNPKTRMPDFTHDILLDIKGNEARKLFTVKGVSHGIELKLMEEVVGFGSVIKGSRLTKQLQLANFGDIRAKFKWDTKAYSKNFTILPESGYIPPHEDIYLEITFHPNKVDDDICAKNIKCEYTGGSSLSLTLMGKCIAQDKEATKEIHFETVVRKATTQNVSINNPTDKEWRIKPTISTNVDSIKEYFKGSDTLIVPPKGTAEYQVTYIPLTMTKQKEVVKEKEVAKEKEDKKEKEAAKDAEEKQIITIYHEASLFFPLPDGKAEFYNLFGKSNKPDVSGTFEERVQAKKPKYINIPVENWLKATQRFKVTTEMEEEQKEETTFIRGANTFDVAANSTKDYKLNFLTYKAGETNFKVKFLNEQTGEYMFFKVKVIAEEPGLQSSIELACPVRETASKMIIIENPTSKEITVKREEFAYDNEYIEIAPASITIPPQSERGFEVSYRPLVVSEEKEDLVLNSAALGTYKYELVLKGLVSTAQRSLHFNCTLGSELVQQFTVKHYLKKATTYSVKAEDMVGHPSTCFKIEQQSVQAPAADNNNGVNISVNVRFEPNIIGEIRAILKLTSPENIEYTWMLYGHSTAPQPQGPFKIGGGAKGEKGGKGSSSSVSIEFKNPLAEKAQFIATFDNPTFMLSSKMPDFLEPGKSIQLQVTRGKDDDSKHPPTGRMIVSTKGLPPWVYYLSCEE